MRLPILSVATVGTIVLFSAAAIAEDICDPLLKFGTYDSSDTFSDKDRFAQLKYTICSSQFNDYNQAKSAEVSLGIPISKTLSASFGQTVNESNYTQSRSEFCASGFARATQSDKLISSVRTASPILASAFTDCVLKRRGFVGYATQSKDKEAFTVTLINNKPGADQGFKVTQLNANSPIECRQNEHLATPDGPVHINGSKVIVCNNKNPKKSLLLAVNTSEGAITGPTGGGIELAGTEETIKDLQERVQRLEARALPSGTMSYFNMIDCPQGWSRATELTGRYVVAVGEAYKDQVGRAVGTQLEAEENRPAGQHTHGITNTVPIFNAGRDRLMNGGSSGFLDDSNNYKTNEGHGLKVGTNAPYVQLSACQKQ